MSYNDLLAKLRWCQLRAMESPLESRERKIWQQILRDLELLKTRMTTSGQVANQ